MPLVFEAVDDFAHDAFSLVSAVGELESEGPAMAIPATERVFEIAIVGLPTNLAGRGLDQRQGIDAARAEPAFEVGGAGVSGGGLKPTAAAEAAVGIDEIDEVIGKRLPSPPPGGGWGRLVGGGHRLARRRWAARSLQFFELQVFELHGHGRALVDLQTD